MRFSLRIIRHRFIGRRAAAGRVADNHQLVNLFIAIFRLEIRLSEFLVQCFQPSEEIFCLLNSQAADPAPDMEIKRIRRIVGLLSRRPPVQPEHEEPAEEQHPEKDKEHGRHGPVE